jgi:hypothetical protein
MTYDQFITQLRSLLVTGNDMLRKANSGQYQFREWRHRVENLVHNVEDEGYVLPGGFNSGNRTYRVANISGVSDARQQAKFDHDLGDTLIELRFFVEQFDTSGAPRKRSPPALMAVPKGGSALPDMPVPTADVPTPLPSSDETPSEPASPAPLAKPEQVTWKWMHEHVPISLWLTFAGAAVVIFLAGLTSGQIPAMRSIICPFKADACSTASTVPEKAGAPPSLFLQFSDGKTAPKGIRSTNIRNWWADWSPSVQIDELETTSNTVTRSMSVPPHWVIFMLFEKPAAYRQLIPSCAGPGKPVCGVAVADSQFAIVNINGDVTQMTLDVSTIQ